MKLPRLSASRLKTVADCSWVYWCKYILRLEDESNDGARRGTVTHLVLECLLKKRRWKLYKKIVKEKDLELFPNIVNLIRRSMKDEGIVNELDNKGNDNYELIKKMIMVGLTTDFLCADNKKPKELLPEEHFNYIHKVNGDSIYHINGFIDKIAKYAKKDKQRIVDYKTSQKKFTRIELEKNIQGMMYALYNLRVRRAMSIVSFLFLRFEEPTQSLEFTEHELKAFEEYLIYMSDYLQDFDVKKATSSFAWDKGFPDKEEGFCKRLKCNSYAKYKGQLKVNGEKMWCCPFKWEYDYWAEYDGEGELIAGHLNKVEVKKGHTIIKQNYKGCPKFNGGQTTEKHKLLTGDF